MISGDVVRRRMYDPQDTELCSECWGPKQPLDYLQVEMVLEAALLSITEILAAEWRPLDFEAVAALMDGFIGLVNRRGACECAGNTAKTRGRKHAPLKVKKQEYPSPVPGHFWLYRLWTTDERLLYVGITRNLEARMRRHRERFGSAFSRVTHEVYGSHAEVLEAERVAIANEHPAFNLEGV